MPDARVTLRRSSPYCTRSNRFKKIRTPGGRLVVQYLKKRGKVPRCGDTGATLFGVAVRRPKELMRLSKPKKTVSRCYGGTLSGKAVRTRIIRAFLVEEQKIVKKVLKQKQLQKEQETHQQKDQDKQKKKSQQKQSQKQSKKQKK